MRAFCMSYPEKSSITCTDKFTVSCTEKMGLLHIEKSAKFLVGREVTGSFCRKSTLSHTEKSDVPLRENPTKSFIEKLAVPIAQN
jgi:hypothetical protein